MFYIWGGFEPQWGHFLEEYCTRLWFCLKNEVDCKIAYCGYNCEQNEMPKSFRDFFEFLGIKKEQLFDVRKPIKCKRIIIPEQSFLRYQYYTDDYKDLIDTVYRNGVNCNLTSYEKIYLSRVGFIKKNSPEKERGEWEIQETFRKNGYKILEPETLSLGEQMFYIRHCHILASTLGSVSANAVFASNKIKLIYLRKALSVVPETFQIDQMINAENVTFIDCFFKPYKKFPLAYGAGPHFIGATKEFRKFIKKNSLKLLNSRLYIHAFIKNWFWITNKYRQYNLSKYLDNIIFIKMRKKIRWLIKHEITNFIIYPFGKFGNIAKSILDEIEDARYICVDHYKCLENKMIFDINVLEDDRFLNYYILICSDKRSTHYQSVKDTVFQKVREKNRIIEFFN